MNYKTISLIAATVLFMATTVSVYAQTDEPTIISLSQHGFEFTVRENSVVTYEKGGNGFSAIYNSKGGGKGTQPDYGLIVYSAESHRFSSAEAQAAGFDPAIETDALTTVFANQADWQAAYAAQMAVHSREQSGLAIVELEEDQTIEVPYYSWSVSVGTRKAHALTYVVKHGSSFIHVQVESATALAPADLEWLTTHLSLFDRQDETS